MEVKRKYHIDILRILACFAVVFNHFDPGFFSFNAKEYGSFDYWFMMFFSVFCKFAVPLFFMISGALLLKKDEPLKTVFKKRILKIVISLLVISIAYLLYERYFLKNYSSEISTLYTGQTEYHLWYLYAYIAFLLSIPFLRSIAKDLTQSKARYLILLFVAVRYFIPVCEQLFFNGRFKLNGYTSGIFIGADIFFYPLIGYYIENKFDIKSLSSNRLLYLWALNIICILVAMFTTSTLNNGVNEVNQRFISSFSAINAITIFLSIKRLDLSNLSTKKQKFILHLSGCTFGIYLIHLFAMRYINIFPGIEAYYDLSACIQAPIWLLVSAFVLIISYLIISILKKVPLIRNIF